LPSELQSRPKIPRTPLDGGKVAPDATQGQDILPE